MCKDGANLPGMTEAEAKRIRVEQAVVRLVETLAEIEGTPYFKATVISGVAGHFDLVVEKRTRVVKPPPATSASISS